MGAVVEKTLHVALGSTVRLEGEVYSARLAKTPKDLTGAALRMTIAKDYSGTSSAELWSVSEPDAAIVKDAEAGTFTITLSAATTAAFRSSLELGAVNRYPRTARGVYDVELEEPDGTVTRLAQGEVIFSDEVTR